MRILTNYNLLERFFSLQTVYMLFFNVVDLYRCVAEAYVVDVHKTEGTTYSRVLKFSSKLNLLLLKILQRNHPG